MKIDFWVDESEITSNVIDFAYTPRFFFVGMNNQTEFDLVIDANMTPIVYFNFSED